ncbi:MAG: PLP-dependent aminotransferase family protein [Gemmatales bacterium]|nr:PLP-dependent aminotransferase family protein [Gemmatales bacterium]
MAPPIRFSQLSQRTGDPPISYFMRQAVENPNLISLAAGLVDMETLPVGEMRASLDALLTAPDRAQKALQYGTTQGLLELRQALLRHLCRLEHCTPMELNLTADDVVITTGSQQLLYILSEALLDPGDVVITAAPSYFVYHGVLQSLGARVLGVSGDEQGLNTQELEKLLARLTPSELSRLKVIYVVSYYENPTGAILSVPRRQHLLELVQRYSTEHRILVVEDAAYRELRYEGEDWPSIKRFDPNNEFVALIMTFSKPWAPGIKIGYGFLPRDLMPAVLRIKGNHDFGSANLVQHAMLEMLESGAYARHVQQLVAHYRRKRDVLLEALAEFLPPSWGITWWRPRGGLYVWVVGPKTFDTGPSGPLLQRAIQEGVLYVPGEFCYPPGMQHVPRHEMRLSFGLAKIDELREGVRRLARALAHCI